MTYSILDEGQPRLEVERLAPPMTCDVGAVLAEGRRLRRRRQVTRAVGATAATGLGAFVLTAVLNGMPSPSPVAAPPEAVVAASDLLGVLGRPDSGRAPLDQDPSISLEIVDSARFLGGTTGGDAYAAVDADGQICLVLRAPRDADVWITDYSCATLDAFTRSGVQLSPGPDSSSTVWLVPDGFNHTKEGWTTAGDNLLESEPTYQTNDLGLTYGPMVSGTAARLPDLIPVLADNGREGYVYRVALYDSEPSGPARDDMVDPDDPDHIPVYESDGVTQIGTYPRP